MSATIKRKHLVLTGLVIALGTAMFVNWYYTKPEAKSVNLSLIHISEPTRH